MRGEAATGLSLFQSRVRFAGEWKERWKPVGASGVSNAEAAQPAWHGTGDNRQ